MHRYSHMLKTFVSGGLLGLIRLASGLIRIKYIAVAIGVSGVGLIAQATQFYLLSVALMTMSMAVGLINLTRAGKVVENDEMKIRVQSTALFTILLISSIYLCLALYFSEQVLTLVFDQHLPLSYYYIFALGLPFSAISSGYIEGIFFARDRYDLYVKASSVATLLELFAFGILVYHFGLKGVFIGIGLSGPILFFAFYFYLRQLGEPVRDLFKVNFHWPEFIGIMKYSVTVLSSAAFGYLTTLWARAIIIKDLGTDANGIIQPAIALSAYAMPFITNGVWGHLHPAASRWGNGAASRGELQSTLKLVASLSCISALSFITFADLLIPLIYSPSFIQGSDTFPFQFLGDQFYYIFFTVNVFLLATSRLKFYFFNWSVYYLGILLLVTFLSKDLGIRAYSASHLIISFIVFVISSIYLFKNAVVEFNSALRYFILLAFVGLAAGLKIYDVGFLMNLAVWMAGLGYALVQPRLGSKPDLLSTEESI